MRTRSRVLLALGALAVVLLGILGIAAKGRSSARLAAVEVKPPEGPVLPAPAAARTPPKLAPAALTAQSPAPDPNELIRDPSDPTRDLLLPRSIWARRDAVKAGLAKPSQVTEEIPREEFFKQFAAEVCKCKDVACLKIVEQEHMMKKSALENYDPEVVKKSLAEAKDCKTRIFAARPRAPLPDSPPYYEPPTAAAEGGPKPTQRN